MAAVWVEGQMDPNERKEQETLVDTHLSFPENHIRA